MRRRDGILPDVERFHRPMADRESGEWKVGRSRDGIPPYNLMMQSDFRFTEFASGTSGQTVRFFREMTAQPSPFKRACAIIIALLLFIPVFLLLLAIITAVLLFFIVLTAIAWIAAALRGVLPRRDGRSSNIKVIRR